MPGVDAVFWVVCLVLVVAGASKLADPGPIASTLSALGFGGRIVGRLVGAVEVAVGITAMSLGGTATGVAVAVAYLAFGAVVVLARRRGLPSCGCFGARSAPPSIVHVGLDVSSALVAATAVVAGGGSGPVAVADGLAGLGGAGIVVALLLLLATVTVVVVDTMVAEVVEATRALRDQSERDQEEPAGARRDGARSDGRVHVSVEGT